MEIHNAVVMPNHVHVLFQIKAQKDMINKKIKSVSELIGEKIVSLPLFPAMSDQDVADVIEAVKNVCK